MPPDEPPPIDPPPEADDPAEAQRFIDMAREVEVDESPDALDRAFDRIMGSPNRAKNSGLASGAPSKGRRI